MLDSKLCVNINTFANNRTCSHPSMLATPSPVISVHVSFPVPELSEAVSRLTWANLVCRFSRSLSFVSSSIESFSFAWDSS